MVAAMFMNITFLLIDETYGYLQKFSDVSNHNVKQVLHSGGHKRCALVQVQKTHDWSELLCRVHKQGCQGLAGGHRDAFSSSSERRTIGASAARFDRPARQATEPRAKREAMFALCRGSGGRFNVRAE